MTEQTDVDTDDDEILVEPGSMNDNLSFVRPDAELENLVSLANDMGLGMSLTIVTSGGVVSGTLVGYTQFWEAAAGVFEGMKVKDEAGAKVVELLSESFRKRAEEETADGEDDLIWPPRYIHLKDARVRRGMQDVHLGLWRGRIALVSGWSFGYTE